MADRLTAAFSPFDVLVFTLAGAFVIAGAWWGIDGVPDFSPSAAAVLGLVAASYLAGHVVAAVSGAVWGQIVWKVFESPFHGFVDRAFKADDGAPLRFRKAFTDIDELPVADRAELIRTVLRQQKLDSRVETMNTIAWVSQSLTTAAAGLALLFVALAVFDGDSRRLLPAAGGMVVVAAAFATRAAGYQRVTARTLMFEALASVDPPERMRQADEMSSPTSDEPTAG